MTRQPRYRSFARLAVIGVGLAGAALGCGTAAEPDPEGTLQAFASGSPDVVISQLYGGGGSSGAPFENDYVELFNRSEHTKTVSGVARSLGAPVVSVRARADDGALVEIVVAWELCWYRYEVDLADEPHAVRLLGQGYELSELGEGTGPANAVADGRGALALGA